MSYHRTRTCTDPYCCRGGCPTDRRRAAERRSHEEQERSCPPADSPFWLRSEGQA